MIIQIDQHRNVSIVRCRGRIVSGICCEAVRSAVNLQRNQDIVLDLTAVDAIDAAGLGVLIEAMLWARANGRPFVILNPNRQVHNAIRHTALDKVIPVWQTQPGFASHDALAAVTARPCSGELAPESSLRSEDSCGGLISA